MRFGFGGSGSWWVELSVVSCWNEPSILGGMEATEDSAVGRCRADGSLRPNVDERWMGVESNGENHIAYRAFRIGHHRLVADPLPPCFIGSRRRWLDCKRLRPVSGFMPSPPVLSSCQTLIGGAECLPMNRKSKKSSHPGRISPFGSRSVVYPATRPSVLQDCWACEA